MGILSARSLAQSSARRVRVRPFPVEAALAYTREHQAAQTRSASIAFVPAQPVGGVEGALHPLADPAVERALEARRERIEQTFAAISERLERLAHESIHERGYRSALATIAAEWGLDFGLESPPYHWAHPLPWGEIHAHGVLAAFARLAAEGNALSALEQTEGEPVEALVARFGFHAIDLVPCADGRLAGLTEHILRVPRAIVTARRSYAGAMFDIDEAVAAWRAVEIERLRRQVAGQVLPPSRFLKIGVYHVSGSHPQHEGCAAHGSNDTRAMSALLERLVSFQAAVEIQHGERPAILLIGVDTDNDAIRVHVPDADGRVHIERFVSSNDLRHLTRRLPREAGKALIRERVAACAGVAPDDAATEGMRWLCGYLLKNNIGQVEAVERLYGGRYPDLGHAERLIVAGDPIDEVQLRNLAFQTQFTTLEEGARDVAVGLRLLAHTHAPRGYAIPVLTTARYDERLPGARVRAQERAERHAEAIRSRYPHGVDGASLVVRAAIVDRSGRIEFVAPPRLSVGALSSSAHAEALS
ncbi:MAG: carboxysome shell carbonic anhydrase [Casimicrobiaceae bacterium]|nr:carboxysome shell carbonic anhydrase [Casimicrobiaceae bacterium]